MATPLPTDFVDETLAASMNGKRHYNMTTDAYGTFFTDVTEYEQRGSVFGARQINDIDEHINALQNSFGDLGNAINITTNISTPASAVASVDNCVAIGFNTNASGINSIAIGQAANTKNASFATALGYQANAVGYGATALSVNANASGQQSIAIGDASKASSVGSIAIGKNTNASSTSAIAIGEDARACSALSIAIGYNGFANAANAIVIGSNASSNSANSIALGTNAIATNNNTTAIGYYANAKGNNSIAIGYQATTSYRDSIAIGTNTSNGREYSIAIGYNAKTNSSADSIAIGSNINSTGGIYLGQNLSGMGGGIIIGVSQNYYSSYYMDKIIIGKYMNHYDGDIIPSDFIAIGYNINTYGAQNSVAIGESISIKGFGSIMIGQQTACNSGSSVAIGGFIDQNANKSISIGGARVLANSQNSIALGEFAEINGNGSHSIAIGDRSVTYGNYSVALGANARCAENNAIRLGDYYLSKLSCTVSLTVTSDIRDKTDIVPIDSAIKFLSKIEPITYVSNMRSLYEFDYHKTVTDEDGNETVVDENPYKDYGFTPYDKREHAKGTKKGTRRRAGMSAQNIREAMVEVYGTDNYANLISDNLYDMKDVPEEVESHLGVQYEVFVPFLIKAVQELQEQINDLKKKLK